MLLEVVVLLVITWLIERRWRLRKQFALGKQLKTSLKSYPIIGHSLMFIGTDEESTLGMSINSQRARNNELKSAIGEMCEIAAWRICQPWLRNDFVFKLLSPYYNVGIRHRTTFCDFITKIIKEKRNLANKKKCAWTSIEETNSDMTSFLDLQLEAPEDQKLTDKELLEEIMLLILASYDTSTTALGFTALMLSRHPDVQEKICEELIEVFGESDRPITARDLAQLKYLEAVIKESLRLFPPVPLLVRRADKDVTLHCGILLNVWALQRNPVYWGEDADLFRPERFLNLTLKHSTAFMPFSSGLRNCIGIQFAMLSMKTVILTLLRRYKLLPLPGVKNEEPVRTKFDLMLRHVDNFKIKLENRV